MECFDTNHKTGSGHSFAKTLLDNRIGVYDFGQLDGDVVFVAIGPSLVGTGIRNRLWRPTLRHPAEPKVGYKQVVLIYIAIGIPPAVRALDSDREAHSPKLAISNPS